MKTGKNRYFVEIRCAWDICTKLPITLNPLNVWPTTWYREGREFKGLSDSAGIFKQYAKTGVLQARETPVFCKFGNETTGLLEISKTA